MERKQYKVELPEMVLYELGKYVDDSSGKSLNGRIVWSKLKPLKNNNHALVWVSLDKEGYVPFLVHATWLVLLKVLPQTFNEFYDGGRRFPNGMLTLDIARDSWYGSLENEKLKESNVLDQVRELWKVKDRNFTGSCVWIPFEDAEKITELLKP